MKIFVYNYREFDEAEYFEKFSKEYHVELGICKEAPSLENAYLVKGYEYVSIITTKIDRPLLEKFREFGVKMISTRTVGYDHIDLEAARQLGIRVSNVSYSPECVADYTMMLILMSIRKMKRIMQRAEINDFSLPGIQGRELPNFTIGVLGTGRIGQAVIRDLHGFGCKIYAYDKYENEAVKQFAEYADLSVIYEKCDLITLHMPLSEDNFHIIDASAMKNMKDGVVIINTARGSLIDTKALIEALESGKVGAAGLDVIEDELGMYYYNRKSDILSKRDLYVLRGFPNVIVTPHIGEMSRLCGKSIGDIQDCLVQTAFDYAKETKAVCVLKDACTVVSGASEERYLNISGNAGMATAGSGDVLSGVIAGVLCMYLKAERKPSMAMMAALGVYVHGLAGDLAAETVGQRGMTAGDIIRFLPEILK